MIKFLPFILLFTFTNLKAQETYSVDCTTYYEDQCYTTGHPKVKRSQANVKRFLKSFGLEQVPVGYEVDHIIPLSEGGTDEIDNMQLLTVEEHKIKTAGERARLAQHLNYSDPITGAGTTSYPQPTDSATTTTTTSSPSTSTNSSETIQTEPTGGRHYINNNSNNTGIKIN